MKTKSEIDINSTDTLQIYGAYLDGEGFGCQDYTMPVKLRGVRIVNEAWLLALIAERNHLRDECGMLREEIQDLHMEIRVRGEYE